LASFELIFTPSFGVMLLMIYWRRRSFRSHSISRFCHFERSEKPQIPRVRSG
jgi:hypothetical protein